MADPLKIICDELKVCRQEALFYLEGFRWVLDVAMEACRTKTLPSPFLTVQSSAGNEKSASEEQSRNEKIVNFIECCVGSTVDDATQYLSIHNWNIEVAVNNFIEEHRPTLSERKWNSKNRRSNSQPFSKDDCTAIEQSNLQRFSGDETSKAVTSNVLSTVPQFPTKSTDFIIRSSSSSSSEEIDRRETLNKFERGEMQSRMSSSQEPNPSQLKEEIVKIFRGRAIGASPQAALDCLYNCNWNVEEAISYFFGDYRIVSPGMAKAQMVKNFTASKTESLEHIPEAVPPMASSQVTPNSQTQLYTEQLIGSSQLPSQMRQFQLQKEFCNIAPEASPKAAYDCLTYCKWNLQEALTYFLKGEHREASPKMASSQVDNLLVPPITKSAEMPQNSQAQLYDEKLITSFLEVAVGSSREEAIEYLEVCDWNINLAADNFVAGYSVEQLSTAKIMSLTQNRRRTMGLPSQSQFEASYVPQSQGYLKEGGTGSSFSSITAGPTETQRSLEEAGEGNVTVAIPRMASSQVDLKKKAVEEGSSTETFLDSGKDTTIVGTQTAPDNIAITVILADGSGTSLDLTFRSNETVKDIRNAIHERAADNDEDYYLQSVTGEEYRDLNVTVHKIYTRGCTTLIQVFPEQQP